MKIAANAILMKMRFIIYGLTGWIAEIVFTGIGSLLRGDMTMHAWTYIWMFPIYGLMVFLEPVHNKVRFAPVFIRGGVYTLLIFFAEYVTGWMLKLLIGKCPWSYGANIYSVEGIITLTFIPVWFIGGLLFEVLHDFLDHSGIEAVVRTKKD